MPATIPQSPIVRITTTADPLGSVRPVGNNAFGDAATVYYGIGTFLTGIASLAKFSQALVATINTTITHSLGDSNVIVQVYDSTGAQVTPSVIDIIDSNNVNVQFSTAFTGTAIIIGGTTGPATAISFLDLSDTPNSYAGQALMGVRVNAGATALEFFTTASGTVTNVSSANADISVATPTTTPVLTLNSGTAANQIVKLNGSAQLPAVSGINLTNITGSTAVTGFRLLAADPGGPATGDVWFNTTDAQFKGYNGTSIIILG